MPGIADIPPDLLKNRHRLTAAQINSVLGYPALAEDIDEKLKGLELVKEFVSVSDLLGKNRISFIPLKGPVLSYRIYNDPLTRRYHDLDFLLDINDITESIRLLRESGYREIFIHWPTTSGSKTNLARHTNHVALVSQDNRTVIELHWRLLRTSPVGNNTLDELVWKNTKQIEFGGRILNVLNNELDLLYLIIHAGLHGWNRLKWLLDIEQYLSTQLIDWNRFSELASELKARKMVGLYKNISNVCFPGNKDIPGDYPVSRSLTSYAIGRIEADDETKDLKTTDQLRQIMYSLSAFPGIRYKMKEFTGYFFVSLHFGKLRKIFGRLFGGSGKYHYTTVTSIGESKQTI
jgi:hypothetical protein